MGNTTTAGTPDSLDVSGIELWSLSPRERDEVFARLRREAPVSWQRPPDGGLLPATQGYWAIVRHADIRHVSRHPELFCSGQGISFDDVPAELAEMSAAFIVMDAPQHTRMRGLVNHAFTPRRVRTIQQQIEAQAVAIVAAAVRLDDIEVVRDISIRLPLWTISEMLGVPPERRDDLYDAANIMVGTADEEFVAEGEDPLVVLFGGVTALHQLAHELQAARKAEPGDDLMSALVAAEVDGDVLTENEIAAFLVLLAVAGNDTTRNTISHSIKAFSDHPEQWDLLRSDPDAYLGTAVEEMIRWASPVLTFRRTATQDTELNGTLIREGERVVLFYASANRDDDVFTDPWSFDITRRPNEHVGFGGGGPHFCLGALIARTQLRAIFSEFIKHVERFDAGEIDYVTGNLINNIRRLPCRLQVRQAV